MNLCGNKRSGRPGAHGWCAAGVRHGTGRSVRWRCEACMKELASFESMPDVITR